MANIASDVEVDCLELARNITMKVTLRGTKRFKIRMAIVSLLIRFAALIAPVNVEIESQE